VWRLAAADHKGVPYRNGRARSVTIGATVDWGDGERLWFRVRGDGGGDRLSPAPIVAEVRTGPRARERVEAATGMYQGLGWVVVDEPRIIDAPPAPMQPQEILAGWPLVEWARETVEHIRGGGGS